MPETPAVSTAGIRLHQFAARVLPIMADLSGWLPLVFVALGLSFAAMLSTRLAVLGVNRVRVMVLEDDVLRIAAVRGIAADVAARVPVPVPQRICGQVFASGTPAVLAEAQTPSPFDPLGLDVPGGLACYPLEAALATAARKVGVINVTDHRSGPFSPEDLAELQFIAEASAIGLSSQMDRRDLEQANYAAMRSLALAIEAKDPYTHGHSERFQRWATTMAEDLGLSGRRMQIFSYAVGLHDIGELSIPDEVLKAPRRLTPDSDFQDPLDSSALRAYGAIIGARAKHNSAPSRRMTRRRAARPGREARLWVRPTRVKTLRCSPASAFSWLGWHGAGLLSRTLFI